MCSFFDNKKIHSNRSKIFIVSAPSGAGKTTLCKIASKQISNLVYSVSYTTRNPRKGEINGVDYYFISKNKFIEGIKKGEWIEWSKVHENFYGTSLFFLKQYLITGNDILLDIDVHGAKNILQKYPDAITIFITPPSLKELEIRLRNRGSDNDEVIKKRLNIAKLEMKKINFYQYVVVNNNLGKAVSDFIAIFRQNSQT